LRVVLSKNNGRLWVGRFNFRVPITCPNDRTHLLSSAIPSTSACQTFCILVRWIFSSAPIPQHSLGSLAHEWQHAVRISPYAQLLSHFRFFLTLRSQEGKYHPLIIFRLSSAQDLCSTDSGLANKDGKSHCQIYVMEATCPHLGADLSHAEIEECESSVVAVCPWHRCVIDLFWCPFILDLFMLK
jgi:hypothetical protein